MRPTAPSTAPPDAPNTERRRSYRQAMMVKGLLYLDSNASAPWRVRIRNVSMGGVAFESQTPIEKGTRLRLVIELGPARLNWRVRVVCCGKMGDGGYLIGGQFLTNELEPAVRADEDPSPHQSLHIQDPARRANPIRE